MRRELVLSLKPPHVAGALSRRSRRGISVSASFTSPSQSRSATISLISLLVLMLAVPGCFGSSGPQRFKVTGTVKLDGQPVPKGILTMIPAANTPGPAAGADIVDGKFLINKSEGPIAGDYVFQFTGASDKPSGQFLEIKSGVKEALMLPVFPDKFGMSSKEVRTIGPDSRHFDFDLKTAD